MEKELEFCEYFCGELSKEQMAVMGHMVQSGRFLGVARAVGGMGLMPAYKGYPSGVWHVIDQRGYGQLSSSDGRLLYQTEWHISAYYYDRTERSVHGH